MPFPNLKAVRSTSQMILVSLQTTLLLLPMVLKTQFLQWDVMKFLF
jgi:hypothetical protein